YALADGLTISQLRNSQIHIAPVGATATPQSFNWNTPSVTMPSGHVDGQLFSIRITTNSDTGAVMVGNELQVRVLTADGDFDGDGLSNKLELDNGLDPANRDSDGNGIDD